MVMGDREKLELEVVNLLQMALMHVTQKMDILKRHALMVRISGYCGTSTVRVHSNVLDILDKEMSLSRSEQVELLNNYLNLNDKGISYSEESNTIDVCLDKQLTQEQIYLLKGRYNMQYAMV